MQRKTKDCGQPSGPGREMWKWFSQNLQFEPTLQTLRSGTSSLQNYTRIHFCYAKSLSLWWGFCLFVLFFYSSLRRPAQVPCKGWLQQSFSIGLGSMVKGESFPWKVGCSVSWAWYRSDLLQAATTQSGQLSQKDAGNLKRRLLHTQKLYCHSQRKPGLWWTKMEVSLSMQISNYRAKEMRNLWQSLNTGDGRMILQICVSCSSALSGGALGNEASREQWRFIICRCRQLATDALWKKWDEMMLNLFLNEILSSLWLLFPPSWHFIYQTDISRKDFFIGMNSCLFLPDSKNKCIPHRTRIWNSKGYSR